MSSDSGAHRTGGLYRVLESPRVYRALMNALGARALRRFLVDQVLRCRGGESVLDVGCGAADMLEFLPHDVRYTGYDLNPRYISMARERWGDRGKFLVGSAGGLVDADLGGPFDRVLLIALLHHLDDDDAAQVIAQAKRLLSPSGWLIALDNAFVPGQSRVARFLIERDRGARVRTPERYASLLEAEFATVEWSVRGDLIRVPYTHFVARASAVGRAVSR